MADGCLYAACSVLCLLRPIGLVYAPFWGATKPCSALRLRCCGAHRAFCHGRPCVALTMQLMTCMVDMHLLVWLGAWVHRSPWQPAKPQSDI